MGYHLTTVAVAMLMLSTPGALAQPTYEIMGFPITQHQLAAVNSTYVQEAPPNPTLTVAGMPASPVQILILSPRSRRIVATDERGARPGLVAGPSNSVSVATGADEASQSQDPPNRR